jgi:hypothetical protein
VATRTWLCAAAVAGTAAALWAADSDGSFGVGVLRRDGVIIPFATFDGRRWRNAWPNPQPELTVPINLDSVPARWWGPTGPLATWQAWTEDAEHTLHVTQPDWVDVHCARHIALRTDYRADGVLPIRVEQPYPKDGLAIAPPRRVERIAVLPPTATELIALEPVLLDAFNRGEREVASRTNHPMARSGREIVEPMIEAAYAFGDSTRFYYVESIRAYRSLGQRVDECLAIAFGTGWFVREGGKLSSLVMMVDLLGCNRYGASYMLPLGVVRAADRLFWIAQFSGWEHERYAVLELSPKKVEVKISTWGGGC